jgi:hypothetical protein
VAIMAHLIGCWIKLEVLAIKPLKVRSLGLLLYWDYVIFLKLPSSGEIYHVVKNLVPPTDLKHKV